jgi:hypothetical protein
VEAFRERHGLYRTERPYDADVPALYYDERARREDYYNDYQNRVKEIQSLQTRSY